MSTLFASSFFKVPVDKLNNIMLIIWKFPKSIAGSHKTSLWATCSLCATCLRPLLYSNFCRYYSADMVMVLKAQYCRMIAFSYVTLTYYYVLPWGCGKFYLYITDTYQFKVIVFILVKAAMNNFLHSFTQMRIDPWFTTHSVYYVLSSQMHLHKGT